MNLGSTELLILVIIVVVVFGGSWLPKAARNLGRAKVEVDKAQKQLADTKNQVVEATGLDKAEAAMKKANKALSTSPQSLMRDAAKSAIGPGRPDASTEGADAASEDGEIGADGEPVVDAEVVERRSPPEPAEADRTETINVDFDES